MIGNLLIIFVILWVITLIIMSYTTRKRFDKILYKRNIPLPLNYAFLFPNTWGRAQTYVVNILFFKAVTKQNASARYRRYHKTYGDFSFYQYATKLDMVLSVLNLLFCLIALISLCFLISQGVNK